ncbi:MAG: hypothetical protein J6M31_06950 [Bacteroidales bacterium]|nr:hypothetical protein [Bacteroidales bacterium]
MKQLTTLLLALLALVLPAAAQRSSHDEIMADVEKAGGVHYMYPMDQPAPTKAPKGYKPFYISHLGRHGARFALGSTVYTDLWNVLSSAHEKGLLTAQGQTLYTAYARLYPLVEKREGNLTLKGQEQHRYIASQMIRNYPAVFKGNTRAEAISTGVHRVIVSMYSCLDQLDTQDRSFTFTADYGYPYQAYLLPPIIDVPTVWPEEVVAKYHALIEETARPAQLLAKWFTDAPALVENPYKFCADLHTVVSTLDNLAAQVPEELTQVFTPEERYRLWFVDNYSLYMRLGMSPEVPNIRPESMKALWQDIVEKADVACSGGPVQLNLRFAHDSSLMPILSLLDINGMGVRSADPAVVADAWRTYNIPMACNLQLVFFRSRRNADILVQVLLNGREATLPLPMAAPGSFYRWADVRAHYAALLP